MKKILTAAFLLITIHFAVVPAIAEMYKWVDGNGVVHYSDTKPADEQKTETFKTHDYQEPPPESGESVLDSLIETISEETKKIEKYLKEKKKADLKNSVEIFTTDWCGYCKIAINFLQSNGIKYTEHNVGNNPQAAARKRELGGGNGVPFAIINGQKVYGFSKERYKHALGLK